MQSKNQNAVNMESFSTISVIGKGSYAKVLLVRKIKDGKFFAMKILKKRSVEQKKQENHVLTERKILIEMNNCPFMINFYYSFQSEKKLYFVLEYCPGGELFELLSKKRKFAEDQARFYAAQMVMALAFMHEKNIIYRDLKPENVLVDIDGYLKITDFGLSRMNVTEKEARSICGTPEYLAPEIIMKIGYGKSIDWWTLGCIIYEMLVGIPPFYSNNRSELFEKIKFSQPKYPKFLSEETKDLLVRLLSKNPEQRLGTKNGAEEIKSHPWFKIVNWEYLLKKQYDAPFKPKVDRDLGLGNFSKEFTDIPRNSYSMTEHEGKHYQGFTYEAKKDSEMSTNSPAPIDMES